MATLIDFGYEYEGFYDGLPFIELDNLKDVCFDVLEVQTFTNDKGDGVAAHIRIGDDEGKIVTHSIGITKVLGDEKVLKGLEADVLTVTLRKGKSKKTGNGFFYLE